MGSEDDDTFNTVKEEREYRIERHSLENKKEMQGFIARPDP